MVLWSSFHHKGIATTKINMLCALTTNLIRLCKYYYGCKQMIRLKFLILFFLAAFVNFSFAMEEVVAQDLFVKKPLSSINKKKRERGKRKLKKLNEKSKYILNNEHKIVKRFQGDLEDLANGISDLDVNELLKKIENNKAEEIINPLVSILCSEGSDILLTNKIVAIVFFVVSFSKKNILNNYELSQDIIGISNATYNSVKRFVRNDNVCRSGAKAFNCDNGGYSSRSKYEVFMDVYENKIVKKIFKYIYGSNYFNGLYGEDTKHNQASATRHKSNKRR